MNWDQVAGNWEQFKGRMRETWGAFTDDDIARMEGNKEQLVGRIRERYGITREAAEKQVSDWMKNLH